VYSNEQKQFIQRIRMLPTLPIIFQQIIKTIDDPESSVSDLKKIIIKDQSITAKLMNLANSAYYGQPKDIKDISSAMVLLGFATIKRVAIGVSLMKVFAGSRIDIGYLAESIWLHTIETANTARLLGKKLNMQNPEQFYIHGLLHDLGKVVLCQYFQIEYVEIVSISNEQRIHISEAENKVLRFDHAQAGEWLGEIWSFPPSLLASIRYHHKVMEAPKEYRVNVCLVNLANNLCQIVQDVSGSNNFKKPIDSFTLKTLNITEKELDSFIEEVHAEREKVKIFFKSIK